MADHGAVLVTRPEPGCSATAAHLADRGIRAIMAPLLAIRGRAPHLPAPDRIQAMLVTSAHALPALAGAHREVPLYVVGAATAARARALGFRAVISADADAGALSALVSRALRAEAGPLLLAAGAGRSEKLARVLRGEGFRVLRRSVYAAVPLGRLPPAAHAALASGTVATALFFSGETAATFVRLVTEAELRPALAPVAALAIGATAAKLLEPLPFRCVRVAVRPTEEAMFAMLA